jgi:hypothetical protein
MRANWTRFIAAGLGALATLVAQAAWAQVPVIEDQPTPAPATKPAQAPLDLQQPGAAPAPPPAPASPTPAPAGSSAASSTKPTAAMPGGGVGIGVSGERVVKLHDPTDHYWQVAIDGGFMYGTSTKSGVSASVYGGGADINIQYRVGGQMPGTDGGSWSAFGLDLSGGFFGAGLVFSEGNTSNGAGFLLTSGAVSAGYQFMTFGKMDDEDLKQHGFGLFLAGKVGVANTQVLQSDSIPASSTTNAQYGPEIQLTFPEYNYGTAKRAAFYISGFLLPTGDFLFMNIQFGGSFN